MHVPRFALRSAEAGRRLDLFLVCAVGSVIGNRVFLIVTGYPQLGNGTLHISHAIWGAAMMAIAVVFAISFLPPNNRTFVAFIGGCGFGWFIDELGKFITRDVNYFFRPTFALIYIVFVAMYLVFRGIQHRQLAPDEAVLNGLEALKSAAIGELTEARRRAALSLLAQTGADDLFARQVHTLLADEENLPDPSPNRFQRWGHAARAGYLQLSARRSFAVALTWWFAIYAVVGVVATVSLAYDHDVIRGTSEWAMTISSLVGALLMSIGLVRIRHDRLEAYSWFERGILVHIFVTQVFEFDQQQLAAVLGLAVNVGLWVSLRQLIRAEVEHQLVEPVGVASLDSER
jgi:hypothetical protein